MKPCVTTALALGTMLIACDSGSHKMNSDDAKTAILRILEIQEAVYDDQSEENKMRFIETCTDSLMFVAGDDGGMLITPQAYVSDFADGYTRRPYDRTFQFYDETVIVTSLHQGFKLLADDTLFLNSRSTKVFVKEKEQWKMAYVTYAPLPVLYNKTVSIDPKRFMMYTGVYDLGGNIRDSVFIEDGRVYSDVNHTGKSEMLALDDSTFIGKGYFGRIHFTRNKYTFEWTDGQRIDFPKVK